MPLKSLFRLVKDAVSPKKRRARRTAPARPRTSRPGLEALEDRVLLAASLQLIPLPPGADINSYVGVGFQRNQVATLIVPKGQDAENLQVQIDWGDNQRSAGELAHVGPEGTVGDKYQVKGSHIYQQLYTDKQIQVGVVGHIPLKVTAEANASAPPSGLKVGRPRTPPLAGEAQNVFVQVQALPPGADVSTSVYETTPVWVGTLYGKLNGKPDLERSHFSAWVNWGQNEFWTTADVRPDGQVNGAGRYQVWASPPPYTKATEAGHKLPIMVYATGADGTSDADKATEAAVAPNATAEAVRTGLKQVLPGVANPPTVTLNGGVMTASWGGLEIKNALKGTAGDVKSFVDMLGDACRRSPSLKALVWEIVNHPERKVPVSVGRLIGDLGTGFVFVDDFETKLVDVGQLMDLPAALPRDQGVTQGEAIAHFLAERYDAAVRPGKGFDDYHKVGIQAENDYRKDLGAKSSVTAIGLAPNPIPGGNDGGLFHFSDGKKQTVTVDKDFHLHPGPVTPKTPPANLGTAAHAFTHSPEHHGQFVTGAYRTYLGRTPDAAGLSNWVSAMQRGLTDEQLEAGFIGSVEYIVNHGGHGAGWVRGMYQDLLGRTPAQYEVDGWVAALKRGTSAQEVAHGFAASAERDGIRVRDYYFTYLGRTAAQAEVDGWVRAFQNGFSNEDIAAGFVGSAESYARCGQDIPTWLRFTYKSVLGREPDQAGLDYWADYLYRGLPG